MPLMFLGQVGSASVHVFASSHQSLSAFPLRLLSFYSECHLALKNLFFFFFLSCLFSFHLNENLWFLTCFVFANVFRESNLPLGNLKKQNTVFLTFVIKQCSPQKSTLNFSLHFRVSCSLN